MKKVIALLLTLSLLVAMTACGGSASPSAGSAGAQTVPTAAIAPKEPVLSVVHPDFALTRGFIEPVERSAAVPEGYIAISTPEEFCKIGLNPAARYILMGDVDLTGMDFTPIGGFTGLLEGNGYTVFNAPTPLFANVDGGTVQNLGIFSHMTGKEMEGGINYVPAGGLAYNLTNGALVFNCWFEGSIRALSSVVGGLVQHVYSNSSLVSCRNSASITIETDWQNEVIIGGIAADLGKGASIINCFNEGRLEANADSPGVQKMGGIVGQVDIGAAKNGCNTRIYNCRNTGELKGRDYAAGILGWAGIKEEYVTLTLSRCVNEGSAEGAQASAGITNVAFIEDGSIVITDCCNRSAAHFTAGIAGGEGLQVRWKILSKDLMNALVENCYSLSPAEQGIATVLKNLNHCYYAGTNTPATADGALFATVKGLTETQLRQQSSYAGFDFSATWTMGSLYPELGQRGY